MSASKYTLFRAEMERWLSGEGVKAFGVADFVNLKKTCPEAVWDAGLDFACAVVMGLRLQKAAMDGIQAAPTTLYFHHYRQINHRLDTLACQVADRIQDEGFRALAIGASQVVSRNPMRGHVSHRHLGWAAGIGFIGRNNLLVHPRYGAQMRYVSVLTDMPLTVDKPRQGGCGTCNACVAACPAGAIGAESGSFNHDACMEKLTGFSRMPFIGQHICGVCVRACDGSTQGRVVGEWEQEG